MKKLHIAISTNNIEATVTDYNVRLSAEPDLHIAGQYALWRTESLNLSIRQDSKCVSGSLRHLGWEDSCVTEFTQDIDVNDIVWEHFNAQNQADEINNLWPEADYSPKS